MIFITGDTHGEFTGFSNPRFPIQKEMTKDDYVIICGDFGGIWSTLGKNKEENFWLDWLDEKPFTTLFVDGNHENFDRLNKLPEKMMNGGKVHEIRPSIFHLMRGQVYTLQGKTLFTFGGGKSHDIRDGVLEIDDPRYSFWKGDYRKQFRVNHVSWWKEELPSELEMQEGLENLAKHNHQVDYIITHSPTSSLMKIMDDGWGMFETDYLSDYLQKIADTTTYTKWYCGHMHIDQDYPDNHSKCLYKSIIQLV